MRIGSTRKQGLDTPGVADTPTPAPLQPEAPGGISDNDEQEARYDLRGRIALVEEREDGESCQDHDDSRALEHGREQYIRALHRPRSYSAARFCAVSPSGASAALDVQGLPPRGPVLPGRSPAINETRSPRPRSDRPRTRDYRHALGALLPLPRRTEQHNIIPLRREAPSVYGPAEPSGVEEDGPNGMPPPQHEEGRSRRPTKMGTPGKKRMIGKNETKNVMAENEPTALETRRTVDARCGDHDPEHRENNGPDNTGRRAFRIFRDHASPHPPGSSTPPESAAEQCIDIAHVLGGDPVVVPDTVRPSYSAVAPCHSDPINDLTWRRHTRTRHSIPRSGAEPRPQRDKSRCVTGDIGLDRHRSVPSGVASATAASCAPKLEPAQSIRAQGTWPAHR